MKKLESYLTGIVVDGKRDIARNISYYEDPICGIYGIGSFAQSALDGDAWKKRRVACVLAQLRIRGLTQPVLILSRRPETTPADMAAWSYYSVDELVQLWPDTPVELLEESLMNLSFQITHPSELVRVSPQDCWRVYSHDSASAGYVLDQLCDLGFLKYVDADPSTSYSTRIFSIQA
ncbi:hypothetical protein, partial [Termitidicoccus mucosus]|uniref:hypothetical protein n=1 Tax=Termitidicoccus mucosus TaxID=1184151 RepID=UPI002FEE1566